MPIKFVLYVVGFSFPGTTGTPLHAMGIAKAMRDKGLDVRVAHLRPRPLWKSEKDSWDGIPVYRIARPGWGWRLRRLLKDLRPDIVHAHHIGAALFSLKPCKRLGIPLLYECHSFWREEIAERGDKLSPVMRYAVLKEKDLFKKCEHIIALSEKMKTTHMTEMGVHASKVSVIYPGVKHEWIGDRNAAPFKIPGIEPGDFVAMYSGNFAVYQGVDFLLGALSKAAEKHPEIKLVLVGATDEENEKMKALYPGSIGNTIYLGRKPYDEVPSLMARADVLVIPRPNSKICWTMPRKFGEYLSAGRPLLVTDVGDHRRVIEHFNCGLVTNCTPKGIADGLVSLAEMPDDERKKMGHNALKAAREWFDWDSQMDQVRKLYETLTCRR